MIVRIRDEAEAEIEDAFDFYEGRRMGLGQEFLDEFVRGTHRIAEAPNRWPRDDSASNVRRFRLERFPFSIIYRVLADHCMIIAVEQLNRRPGYWRDRLRE